MTRTLLTQHCLTHSLTHSFNHSYVSGSVLSPEKPKTVKHGLCPSEIHGLVEVGMAGVGAQKKYSACAVPCIKG